MINILKLRKLEKEKNVSSESSREINEKKEEEAPILQPSVDKFETVTETLISPELPKNKTKKKTDKKIEKEVTPKVNVKKKNTVRKTKEQIVQVNDNNAEIKELMEEINEIENELKVLEEENVANEKNFLLENQIASTEDGKETQILIPEIAFEPEVINEDKNIEVNLNPADPEETNNKAEIDHAEILRQNLLKELLAEENKTKSEEKAETKVETPKVEPGIIKEEKQQVTYTQEESTRQVIPDVPTPLRQIIEEKPIEQINNIIAAVQRNEHNVKEELKKKTNENIVQLVGFMLSREYYGVDIMKIREIIRMVDITKVPRSPKFIEGVINLRGSVIPVINLRTKVRMPRLEYDKNTRIVIVEIKGTVVGFIVDAVREVLRIQENLLEPPPSITIEKADYITSVAKLEDQLVILMDTEKVLSNEEGIVLTEMSK